MTLKKNDEIILKIESVSSEGSGVGRYNGFAVFVRNSVAGDTVLAHIIKASGNYAVAVIKEIIEPSANRIDSDLFPKAVQRKLHFLLKITRV